MASDPGTVRILHVGALSPAHALLRTVHLPPASTAGLRALAIDEQSNRVFIADLLAGVVYMLDDGRHTPVDDPCGADPRNIAVAEAQNEVFVVNGNRDETNAATLGRGSVSVLNATTGAVVATLPTARIPSRQQSTPGPGGSMSPTMAASACLISHNMIVRGISWRPSPSRM